MSWSEGAGIDLEAMLDQLELPEDDASEEGNGGISGGSVHALGAEPTIEGPARTDQGVRDRAPARWDIDRPAGFRVATKRDTVVLSTGREDWLSVAAFLALVAVAYSLLESWLAVALIALVPAYGALVGLVNRKTARISGRTVEFETGPLPFPSREHFVPNKVRLDVQDIQQFYVRKSSTSAVTYLVARPVYLVLVAVGLLAAVLQPTRTTRSSRCTNGDLLGSHTRFDLVAVVKGVRMELMLGLRPDAALYMAQELERLLGIEDEPVPAEWRDDSRLLVGEQHREQRDKARLVLVEAKAGRERKAAQAGEPQICPDCGAPNRVADAYCGECGGRLPASVQQPVPAKGGRER